MDIEFTKWLATLGIGGVLAGFMFAFYRKDIKQYTELWREQALLSREQTNQLILIIKDNTSSNTKLIQMLETQERNAIRKQDISDLIEHRIGERERKDKL